MKGLEDQGGLAAELLVWSGKGGGRKELLDGPGAGEPVFASQQLRLRPEEELLPVPGGEGSGVLDGVQDPADQVGDADPVPERVPEEFDSQGECPGDRGKNLPAVINSV